MWLPIHRFGGIIFALVWIHGVTAGTDTLALLGMNLNLAVSGGRRCAEGPRDPSG